MNSEETALRKKCNTDLSFNKQNVTHSIGKKLNDGEKKRAKPIFLFRNSGENSCKTR